MGVDGKEQTGMHKMPCLCLCSFLIHPPSSSVCLFSDVCPTPTPICHFMTLLTWSLGHEYIMYVLWSLVMVKWKNMYALCNLIVKLTVSPVF